MLLYVSIASMSGQDTLPSQANTLSQEVERTVISMTEFVPEISPQTKAMMRYDHSSDIMNAGRFTYAVSLIHWDDPDFEFPISLTYSGAGFKPSEPDNFTGKDWSLSCGGAISRKIVGMPDDFLSSEDGTGKTEGFLSTIKQGFNKDSIKDTLLYGNPETIMGMWMTENVLALKNDNFRYEATSDIYYFNFGRHSGKFVIDYDGSIIVYGNDGGKYEVDISDYKPVSSTSDYTSVIRITTDDGYVYSFGGSYGSVEYNSLSWQTTVQTSPYDMKHKNTIIAFYLSKIIAPNGRELHVSYMGEDIDRKFHDNPEYLMSDTYSNEVIKNNYHLYYSYAASPQDKMTLTAKAAYGTPVGSDVSYMFLMPDLNFSNVNKVPINNLNKCALVSSVETDDKKVVFSYSQREKCIYSHDKSKAFPLKCGAQLNKVSLYLGNSVPAIEESILEYKPMTSLLPRLYLSSVDNSIEGKHIFTYNTIGVDPLTYNIDFWGYWRGNVGAEESLIPAIADSTKNGATSYNPTSDYVGDIRQPLYNQAGATMLNSIEFPTGGRINITYENHDYSSYFRKDLNTDYMKVLTDADVNYPCGGARVKSVEFMNGGKIDKRVMYKYTRNENSHLSSGTLGYVPQYWHLCKIVPLGGNGSFMPIYNSDGFNPNDVHVPHVTYSTVIEYWTDSYEYRHIPSSHIEISPPEDDCTKEIVVSAGNHQGTEIPAIDEAAALFSRWQILMDADQSSETSCRITIKRTDDWVTVYDKIVTGERYEEFINPIDMFGVGEYRIEISKSGLCNIKFLTHYPECMNSLLVNGPAVVKTYSDYHTNPDVYHYGKSFWAQTFFYKNCLMPDPIRDEKYYKNNFVIPEDHSVERGKLLQQIYLSANKDTVKTINYKYGKCDPGEVAVYAIKPNVVSGIPCIANYSNVNIERFYCYKPVEVIETECFSDGSKYEKKSYMAYDRWGYMTGCKKELSLESYEMTEYEYGNSIYPGLLTSERYSIINDTDTLQVKRIEYNYWKNKLSGILEYRGDVLINGISVSMHDKYGNPIELQTSQGKIYTILWGYQGKYMVAQIENATYNEVRTALGQDPVNISDMGENILNIIDGLRLKLPNSKIITYRYKPLVGVCQITDESGQTYEYWYDEANRLNTELMINDMNQQVLLSRYTYNVVNQ